MDTYTIEGWMYTCLMVEECGVEESKVDDMVAELMELNYSVRVFKE